jgi:hypothetical protein
VSMCRRVRSIGLHAGSARHGRRRLKRPIGVYVERRSKKKKKEKNKKKGKGKR